MKKLIFTVILALLMLAVSGCATENESGEIKADADNSSAENTGGTNESAEETESDAGEVTDDLGEFNFSGYAFNMFTPDPDIMNWANPILNAEEEVGNVLNDAIYSRNRAVEERFKIVFHEEYGSWDIGVGNLRTIVSSGDHTYDIVSMLDRFALESMTENLVVSYSELPYVDLTKPYWGSELLEYASINNTNYFAFGDFSLYAYDNISALLFNKGFIDAYGLSDPYQLVKDGKWTLDSYAQMCSAVTDDSNGDSVMTEEDIYGYLSMPKQVLPSFWIGGGALSVTKDENDIPVSNLGDEKIVTLITRAFELTWDSGTWYQNTIQDDTDDTLEKMFTSGHGLFLDSTFHKIQRLRDMDADFGIIPYPKQNDSQDTYYTRVSGALFSMVPQTKTELETEGVILEALASESRKTVIPAYYEVSLKSKYSRDAQSQEMLDIMFSTRVYDLGDSFWCDDIRDGYLKTMFVGNDRNIASKTATMEKALNKKISKVVESLTGTGE